LIVVAGTVTDAGRLISVLTAILAAIAVGLFVAARVADQRRAFRISSVGYAVAYIATSVLSASIVVHILKYAIGRARPPLYGQYGILGFRPFDGDFLFQSFPSAHSTHVGALFMALALLFPRLRLLFLSLGLWLGVTRIIIGVHYPSDVATGLALGAGVAFTAAILFSRFGLVFRTGPDGWPIPRLQRPNRRRKTIVNL
jgi:undecaprenyl-diphosphatase